MTPEQCSPKLISIKEAAQEQKVIIVFDNCLRIAPAKENLLSCQEISNSLTGGTYSPIRILIVDEDTIARPLRHLFEASGCSADYVSNGVDAWSLLSDCKYDLIIMEMRIPGINGLELLRMMHKLYSHPAAIMMMDGRFPAIESVAESLGVDGFFYKPFSLTSLCDYAVDLLKAQAELLKA